MTEDKNILFHLFLIMRSMQFCKNILSLSSNLRNFLFIRSFHDIPIESNIHDITRDITVEF